MIHSPYFAARPGMKHFRSVDILPWDQSLEDDIPPQAQSDKEDKTLIARLTQAVSSASIHGISRSHPCVSLNAHRIAEPEGSSRSSSGHRVD
jgi:hypothetical protein